MHSVTTQSTKAVHKVGLNKFRLSWSLRTAKGWMITALLVSDALGLVAAGWVTIALRYVLLGEWRWDLLPQVWPVAMGYIGVASLRNLYPGVGLHPASELKRLSTTITLVVLSLLALTFWTRTSLAYSRMTFGGVWLAALVLLPLGRALTRQMMMALDLWGYPVAIVGRGEGKTWLWNFLLGNKMTGLRPVVAIDCATSKGASGKEQPHLCWEETEDGLLFPFVANIDTAIVLTESLPESVVHYLSSGRSTFKRIVLLPALEHVSSLGVSPFTIDGFLGLEIRNNLLNSVEQRVKRCLDVILVCIGGILISPLLFIVGIVVKWTSPGPIFYGQERIGRGGRRFKAWKFRTMVQDAEQVLEQYLTKHPELRAEWEANQKIKEDPRITRFGQILRKTSLDEFPQLWNVLRGEMSLVGPRPIVENEIEKYGDSFELYKQVRPGLTGLWQVSGRNNTTYEERVRLDEYYVRNWSIWLDIYILAKTVWVVLSREGAY